MVFNLNVKVGVSRPYKYFFVLRLRPPFLVFPARSRRRREAQGLMNQCPTSFSKLSQEIFKLFNRYYLLIKIRAVQKNLFKNDLEIRKKLVSRTSLHFELFIVFFGKPKNSNIKCKYTFKLSEGPPPLLSFVLYPLLLIHVSFHRCLKFNANSSHIKCTVCSFESTSCQISELKKFENLGCQYLSVEHVP